MASNNNYHWLFNTQNAVLQGQSQRHGQILPALDIQLFIFHQQRVLLLRPELVKGATGKSHWTAPSDLTAYDPQAAKSIFKTVMKMIRHAVEERTLVDVQFEDLSSAMKYMEDQWTSEAAVNIKKVQLNIILTVKATTLDKSSFININFPKKYTEMNWFTHAEVAKLKDSDLPPARVAGMFAQLNSYKATRDQMRASIGRTHDEDQRTLDRIKWYCANAIHIRLCFQFFDQGSATSYAILLVRANEEGSPMFLMGITEEINLKIGPDECQTPRVLARIPIPGSTFQTTAYRIVGRVVGSSVARFRKDVQLATIKGVLGDGGRLNLQWMHWNREVTLEGIE